MFKDQDKSSDIEQQPPFVDCKQRKTLSEIRGRDTKPTGAKKLINYVAVHRRPKEQKMWHMYKEYTRTWPVNLRQIQPLLVHSLYICGKQFTRNVSVSYLVCYNSCTFQQHITGKLMSKTCLMKVFFSSWKIHNSIPLHVPVILFLLCIRVSERLFKVPKLQHGHAPHYM